MFRQDANVAFDTLDSMHLQEAPDVAAVAEITHQARHADRVAEAIELATMGLGPAVIAELTGWPRNLVSKLCERAGRRCRGGKARTELADQIKIPLLHAAVGVFVQALEQQATFWDETKLTSRSFTRAVSFARMSYPDAMELMPASGLYSIATEVFRKTVRSTPCKACRSTYAHISLESGLTGLTAFDCPLCRLVNLMLPAKKQKGRENMPTSFADLNLHSTVKRYLSKGAEPAEVRAVFALGIQSISWTHH